MKGVKGDRKEEYLLPCLSESTDPEVKKKKEMKRKKKKVEEGHKGRGGKKEERES